MKEQLAAFAANIKTRRAEKRTANREKRKIIKEFHILPYSLDTQLSSHVTPEAWDSIIHDSSVINPWGNNKKEGLIAVSSDRHHAMPVDDITHDQLSLQQSQTAISQVLSVKPPPFFSHFGFDLRKSSVATRGNLNNAAGELMTPKTATEVAKQVRENFGDAPSEEVLVLAIDNGDNSIASAPKPSFDLAQQQVQTNLEQVAGEHGETYRLPGNHDLEIALYEQQELRREKRTTEMSFPLRRALDTYSQGYKSVLQELGDNGALILLDTEFDNKSFVRDSIQAGTDKLQALANIQDINFNAVFAKVLELTDKQSIGELKGEDMWKLEGKAFSDLVDAFKQGFTESSANIRADIHETLFTFLLIKRRHLQRKEVMNTVKTKNLKYEEKILLGHRPHQTFAHAKRFDKERRAQEREKKKQGESITPKRYRTHIFSGHLHFAYTPKNHFLKRATTLDMIHPKSLLMHESGGPSALNIILHPKDSIITFTREKGVETSEVTVTKKEIKKQGLRRAS